LEFAFEQISFLYSTVSARVGTGIVRPTFGGIDADEQAVVDPAALICWIRVEGLADELELCLSVTGARESRKRTDLGPTDIARPPEPSTPVWL
jgi:hypothetical protein